MGDEPGVVRLMDAKAVAAFEEWSPTKPQPQLITPPLGVVALRIG